MSHQTALGPSARYRHLADFSGRPRRRERSRTARLSCGPWDLAYDHSMYCILDVRFLVLSSSSGHHPIIADLAHIHAAVTVRSASVGPVTARSRSPHAHAVVILLHMAPWRTPGHPAVLHKQAYRIHSTAQSAQSRVLSSGFESLPLRSVLPEPRAASDTRVFAPSRGLATLSVGVQTQGSKPAPFCPAHRDIEVERHHASSGFKDVRRQIDLSHFHLRTPLLPAAVPDLHASPSGSGLLRPFRAVP